MLNDLVSTIVPQTTNELKEEKDEKEEKDVVNYNSLPNIIIPDHININNIIIYRSIHDSSQLEPFSYHIDTLLLECEDDDEIFFTYSDLLDTNKSKQKIHKFLFNKNLNDIKIHYSWIKVKSDLKESGLNTIDDITDVYDNLIHNSTHFNFTYSKNDRGYGYGLIIKIVSKETNNINELIDRKLPLNKCFVLDLPPDFIIYNSIMVENINMKDYIQEDAENIVFITLLNNNTYQGFATNIEHIESSTNIIVECKEEGNSSKFMRKNNTIFNRWYVRLGLDEHNNNKGIFLDKLNSVKDEFDKGNKIFFLSEERTLKTISKLDNIIINIQEHTNIYDQVIDITSGIHCNDNTSINVYDEISVADIETFAGKTEEEKINMVKENNKICKSKE